MEEVPPFDVVHNLYYSSFRFNVRKIEIDHIGECCGKLVDKLGHVGNLPIDAFANDGNLDRFVIL